MKRKTRNDNHTGKCKSEDCQKENPKQLDVHKCILSNICTFSLNVNKKKQTNVEIYMWVKLT